VWNRQAEELWGVRSVEVERTHFFGLDIGLPLERLAQPIRASLAGTLPAHETSLPAVNRRGRTIMCKTTIFPLLARDEDRPRGVIVMMDEERSGTPTDDGGDGASDGAGQSADRTDATR
jgi:two-component system CheB/CheR fusion protein